LQHDFLNHLIHDLENRAAYFCIEMEKTTRLLCQIRRSQSRKSQLKAKTDSFQKLSVLNSDFRPHDVEKAAKESNFVFPGLEVPKNLKQKLDF
jgi:hypothetical protein